MDTLEAYNKWASTYDEVLNKTRDLELIAGREMLASADFSSVLELGCGTGKNTSWLSALATRLTAADFSTEMIGVARRKISSENVQFQQADITLPWNFPKATLITCSLILEHIEDINFILSEASSHLEKGGMLYICELHPYKQLEGSRAKFKSDDQVIQLKYFVHHISDFFIAAQKHSLRCISMKEWFDDNDRSVSPRLISFLFQK